MVATADYDIASSFATHSPSPDSGKAIVAVANEPSEHKYQFIDYRAAASPNHHKNVPPMVTQIIDGLTKRRLLPTDGNSENRSLPTVLLYDDKGLNLFDRITYVPEYYLAECEIDVLKTSTREIVGEIPNDSDVIELGCGSLRKTQLLLAALDQMRSGITYYAIDVMPMPLHSALGTLAEKYKNITFVALCGTYDEVLTHFKKATRRKTLLWLGSSIGNNSRAESIEFLSSITDNALVANDGIIIGMDRKKDPDVIMAAYHDSEGLTNQFELNALSHVNNLISEYTATLKGLISADSVADGIFDVEKFCYTGDYDEVVGRHSAYLEACEDTMISWPRDLAPAVEHICGNSSDIAIKRGERIYIESSYKYGKEDFEILAQGSGLVHSAEWSDSRSYYSLNLFRKPRSTMSPRADVTAAKGPSSNFWGSAEAHAQNPLHLPPNVMAREQPSTIPRKNEWEHLWSVWDTLSLHIIPRSKLIDRPIDLRHPFIFYLGHLSAFADIHMAAAECAPLTQPESFAQWFERGIDPNMVDPTICHSHSEIPAEWPEVNAILAYRDRVRARITNWISVHNETSGVVPTADAARHVWMAFEHEAMHIETMLYMAVQMNPAEICSPIVTTFAAYHGAQPRESWISYTGGSNILLGLHNDSEGALKSQMLPSGHVFGWDNEGPSMAVSVKPFSVRTQPITNGEYLKFLKARLSADQDNCDNLVPKSWVQLGECGDYTVRTVVGNPSITSTEASLWPVFVSQKQATAYASWCGKRLPSEAEWTHASRTYHLARALGKSTSTAQNSFGFQSSQSVDAYLSKLLAMQGIDASEYTHAAFDLFVPADANIGFAHWHPVPEATAHPPDAYTGDDKGNGLPEARFIGNGWEWTSTQFHPFDNFSPSEMYPGYSADFFDPPSTSGADCTHYVVKGASYATHRRMAHRQTFRNWYQRGYPYVLATFRLCDDATE
ncbi:hypothetical protein GGF37_002475 [Kickxella alabastrina]|nr:hypothetical protein GGF37_002475 [Kickxella alabastrina]